MNFSELFIRRPIATSLLMIGVVTEEAITSGLAPGYWATIWIVGKSTGGRAEIGNRK